ncbi:MAG: NAD(P)H-hydrate dehydratase [Clostridia bacterium]|nr:NAD(P)H-hydrate dehydratase [Clostridia bacterium]
MYILTNGQMREADKYTIRDCNMQSLVLMERAGEALANEAEKLAPKGKIVCVCGGGNNGGDGFVCARILSRRGREVDVLFFSEKTSEDCFTNYSRWIEDGGQVCDDFIKNVYALAVDCLFGTGFHGGLNGKYAQIAQELNDEKKRGMKILSADIPSGVNGDNGRVETVAVQADVTLCIGERKLGAILNDGIDYSGEIACADIGIRLPKNTYAELLNKESIYRTLPERKRNSHKGVYGRAAIVAGSAQYTGAAYLSAAACLRSGVGYTSLYVPQDILPYYVLKLPEVLLFSSNEGDRYEFNEEIMRGLLVYDSIAFGMGMGVSMAVALGVKYLLEQFTGRLVLDADALNSLAVYEKENLPKLFQNKKCDVLLTPHVKEFSRLSGKAVQEILNDPIQKTQTFAKEYGVNVLLKNAVSILSDGERIAISVTGTSGQAKGGSGDVLSGVIAGLCASGLSAFDGAKVAAYITGKAAEIAAGELGEYSLTATDCISHLGKAFLFVSKNANDGGENE